MDHKTWRETRQTAVSRANAHLNDVQQAHLATLIRIGEEIDRQDAATQLAYAGFVACFKPEMKTNYAVQLAQCLPHMAFLIELVNYFSGSPSVLDRPDVIRAIRSTSRALMRLGPNWEAT